MDFDRSTVREEFWSFEPDLGTAGRNFASDEQNRRSKETCVDKTKWRQMLRHQEHGITGEDHTHIGGSVPSG